jgi:2-oxoglutarate dehydrogenase E2 component (dihydrolipoamide succinyltransferase)
MDIKILVPSMGESIVEATVVHWYKKVGEAVQTGEPLLELETNKANLDIGAEQSGTLSSIEKGEGQDVRVGETLGVIAAGEGGQAQAQPTAPKPAEAAASQPPAQAESPASPPPVQPEDVQEATPESAPAPAQETTVEPAKNEPAGEERVTPVARRMAAENHLDLAKVTGSGPGGKVLKEDVEKLLAEKKPAAQTSAAPAAPVQAPAPEAELPPAAPSQTAALQPASQVEREERIRMSRRRRTIAQRLVETQATAAMLTTFNDVDMSAVMKIRQERKEAFKEKYGVSLGITSFFIKAVLLALKDFPQLNAEIQGEEMVIKHYYDIGIAVGSEEGLVVPVIKDADKLSFAEIEQAIQGFIQRTKDHKLTLQDVSGGTFTITNGGVFGSLLSTPILNGPEVGILGLHRIEDRPVVVSGEMVIRQMMYLALSYDHRIVDGREAVQFLVRLKEAIQEPERLLLEL